MRKLRIAIVGAGVMGRCYAKALQEYERATLVAICDVQAPSASALAEAYGVAAYRELRTMLQEEQIEAVIIATPDFAHRDPVLEALDLRKAVLCEKPLATTEEDCTAMVEAVERVKQPFMVNFGNRHRPSVCKLKEALAGGRLGRPEYVYIRLNERLSKTLTISWLGQTSPVWFLMSHCADTVMWLLDDEFAEVTAHATEGAVAAHVPGVPDLCVALATTRSGCRVVLETVWSLPEGFSPNIDFYVQVIGERGVLQADLFPHDVNLYANRAETLDHSFDVVGPRGYGAGWWQESVRYFVDGVLEGKPLRPTVKEAAHVSRFLMAVEASLRSARKISVE
ncbi:MAG: Gfo/Idh/MocA family protein [Candidatus Zipacnadales bacterium]